MSVSADVLSGAFAELFSAIRFIRQMASGGNGNERDAGGCLLRKQGFRLHFEQIDK